MNSVPTDSDRVDTWTYSSSNPDQPVVIKYRNGSELRVQSSVFNQEFNEIIGMTLGECLRKYAMPDICAAFMLENPDDPGITIENLRHLASKFYVPDSKNMIPLRAEPKTGPGRAYGLMPREYAKSARPKVIEAIISSSMNTILAHPERHIYNIILNDVTRKIWIGPDPSKR